MGRLLNDRFDVLVVGGGIHGAWTARAAAMRGLSVALVEAEDLAAGTTSRSTMLAHGGLRYLAQFDVGLVKEALHERGLLTRKAPHLVRPIPFLLPFYKDSPYPKWQLKAGIRWYTLLARGSGYPRHRFLSRAKVLALEPGINPKGLTGGALYHDGQILSPERLTTLVALDAAGHGACVANHTSVIGLTRTHRVTGAIVRDAFTGEEAEVRAHTVLNATGPFLDGFLTDVGASDDLLRLTKGVHLITPRFTAHAVVVNATDGRTFFTIPWHKYQLTGTTDTDYTDDPAKVHATAEDVRYLQDSTLEHFPDAPVDKVLFTNAGLRNLLNVEGVHPSQVTRKPLIRNHADEGYAGLFSLAGGKLTTGRATASELLDACEPELLRRAPRVVDLAPLPGGDVSLQTARAAAAETASRAGLDEAVGHRLVALFGSRWQRAASLGLEGVGESAPLTEGEVRLAVREEAALTVEDVVRRRTLAWVEPGQAVGEAEAIAAILVDEGVPSEIAKSSVSAWRETVALHERWRA